MVVEVAKKVIVRQASSFKSASATQQIIVLPSNLLLNSRGGQETMFRLAKAIVPSSANEGKLVLPPRKTINVNVVQRAAAASSLKRLSSLTSLQQQQEQVRKRANLDHMSPEEKLMRRKLKNRVAAQNARDKKRMKMDELEDKLKSLEAENRRTKQENANLLALNKRLFEENQALQNLPMSPSPSVEDVALVEQRSFGSAEGTGPAFGKQEEDADTVAVGYGGGGDLLDVLADDDGAGSVLSSRCGSEQMAEQHKPAAAAAQEAAHVVASQGAAAVSAPCQEHNMFTDLDTWLDSIGSDVSCIEPKIEVTDDPIEEVDFENCFGDLFPDLTS